jgi:ribosome-binding protein aMBF1 (putative translation factor)
MLPEDDNRDMRCNVCGSPVEEIRSTRVDNIFYYQCDECSSELDRLADLEDYYNNLKAAMDNIKKLLS